MKITLTICPKCKSGIFSRANHDFITCPCGAISVDAGFSGYGGRLCWNDKIVKHIDIGYLEVDLDVTKHELYEDWNFRKNKFGIFSKKEVEKFKKLG